MRGWRCSASSCRDWGCTAGSRRRCHCTGAGAGLAGLDRINQRAVATRLRQIEITRHTLDCDASQIVAEKDAAQFTYKGEQGYMPMIGHLAEAGVVNCAASF